MNKQGIASLVNEINLFTPCLSFEEFNYLHELVSGILRFSECFTKTQQKMVVLAIRLSAEWNKGRRRKNKITPYEVHPLETAALLIEMNLATYRRLISAILHDNVEDAGEKGARPIIREIIKRGFGYGVSEVVRLVTKHRHKAIRIRYFITLREAKNLTHRVDAIIIKFCDRINNAETFNILEEEDRDRKIAETLREFPILATVLHKTLKELQERRCGENIEESSHTKLMDRLTLTISVYL